MEKALSLEPCLYPPQAEDTRTSLYTAQSLSFPVLGGQ